MRASILRGLSAGGREQDIAARARQAIAADAARFVRYDHEQSYAALLSGINAGALALARVLTQLRWIVRLIDHGDTAAVDTSSLPIGAQRLHCPP